MHQWREFLESRGLVRRCLTSQQDGNVLRCGGDTEETSSPPSSLGYVKTPRQDPGNGEGNFNPSPWCDDTKDSRGTGSSEKEERTKRKTGHVITRQRVVEVQEVWLPRLRLYVYTQAPITIHVLYRTVKNTVSQRIYCEVRNPSKLIHYPLGLL